MSAYIGMVRKGKRDKGNRFERSETRCAEERKMGRSNKVLGNSNV